METHINSSPQQCIYNPHHTQSEKKKLKAKKQQQKTLTFTPQHSEKWVVVFTYHSPLVRKVTNLFKQSNLRIALHATNTT